MSESTLRTTSFYDVVGQFCVPNVVQIKRGQNFVRRFERDNFLTVMPFLPVPVVARKNLVERPSRTVRSHQPRRGDLFR